MHPRLDAIDERIARWMHRLGHPLHQVGLSLFFVWMGLLKVFGYKTGSSLLAHSIYLGPPEIVVPILGWWEVAIGLTLLFPTTVRLSILLVAVRMPGTLLALVLKPDICFDRVPWAPTLEGQYLIKDLMFLAAAMIIGGTVRKRTRRLHAARRARAGRGEADAAPTSPRP